MKYKVGEWIIYTDKKESDIYNHNWKYRLYNKVGKIVHIDKDPFTNLPYIIEFKDYIGHTVHNHPSLNITVPLKEGHTSWVSQKEIKSYMNHLKLKKLIKHGV